jgi:RecB family exonuclease
MQRRQLIRTRDLAAFRSALVDRATEGGVAAVRRRLVLVPTRASAELLRQTIEARLAADRPAVILPDLVTRSEWIARLHAADGGVEPLPARADRLVLMERAARHTLAVRRFTAPFDLRPGLIEAMLDFYDELRRRQRDVRRFARALFRELGVERGMDRGSEGLIQQTGFLGFTFLAYDRGLAAHGVIDEHRLRARLIARQPALPFDHLVVAVADHPSDPRGLWPADFDLVGRLAAITRIDVVVTDEVHDAGFRDRIEQELPGIEETRATSDETFAPVLLRPASDAATPAPLVFLRRDREEELREAAREIRTEGRGQGTGDRGQGAEGRGQGTGDRGQGAGDRGQGTGDRAKEDDTASPRAERGRRSAVARGWGPAPCKEDDSLSVAIVFQRPLPYLYLAQQVLTDARVPYQAFDALPLAGEPYAALLDLALTVARTGGTREAVVALLRSRLLTIPCDGVRLSARDVGALDRLLLERRTSGDAASYPAAVDAFFGDETWRHGLDRDRAARAARAAVEVTAALEPFRSAPTASAQVSALASFLRQCEAGPAHDDAWRDRHLRARAAVLASLDELAAAFARYDDEPRDADALTALIHHVIEAQTFTPRHGHDGVHLVDAVAARFGVFDHVHLVGLAETDWPDRLRRSVFYGAPLLKALGWPQESDQTRAQQAAFRDLLALARRTTRLSSFQLDGDTVVALSPFVEAARAVPSIEAPAVAWRPCFADEVVTRPVAPEGLDAETAAWLAARRVRPPLTQPSYGGIVRPQPPRSYSVSAVERYVDCPFKYFAARVIRLDEEPTETSGMTPIERGTLLHGLFERFYKDWQAHGQGAITEDSLPAALESFAAIVDEALGVLPPADRELERTRLLGSIVGRGVAERVFEIEADAGGEVRERRLEQPLTGTFTFPRGFSPPQAIAIRGVADRIDVLADGSLRVVDYKLGRMPDLKTSVQIAVYAHCARQAMEAEDGRSHPVSSAAYLAFGDDRQVAGVVGGDKRAPAELAVETLAQRFAMAVADIEAGRFPARPRDPKNCTWCAYAGVCRKEYAAGTAEDEDAADAV